MGHHDIGFLCSEAAAGAAVLPSELAILHFFLGQAVAQKYPFSPGFESDMGRLFTGGRMLIYLLC